MKSFALSRSWKPSPSGTLGLQPPAPPQQPQSPAGPAAAEGSTRAQALRGAARHRRRSAGGMTFPLDFTGLSFNTEVNNAAERSQEKRNYSASKRSFSAPHPAKNTKKSFHFGLVLQEIHHAKTHGTPQTLTSLGSSTSHPALENRRRPGFQGRSRPPRGLSAVLHLRREGADLEQLDSMGLSHTQTGVNPCPAPRAPAMGTLPQLYHQCCSRTLQPSGNWSRRDYKANYRVIDS